MNHVTISACRKSGQDSTAYGDASRKPPTVQAKVTAMRSMPARDTPLRIPRPLKCATTNGRASTHGVYFVEHASPVANPASA